MWLRFFSFALRVLSVKMGGIQGIGIANVLLGVRSVSQQLLGLCVGARFILRTLLVMP